MQQNVKQIAVFFYRILKPDQPVRDTQVQDPFLNKECWAVE